MVRFLPLGLVALVAAAACRRDAAVQDPPVPIRCAPRAVSARSEIRSADRGNVDVDVRIRDDEERLEQHRTRIARLLRDQGDVTTRMTQALARAEERVMELEAQLDVLETTHVEEVLRRVTNY
jgi:hypothetical protein